MDINEFIKREMGIFEESRKEALNLLDELKDMVDEDTMSDFHTCYMRMNEITNRIQAVKEFIGDNDEKK